MRDKLFWIALIIAGIYLFNKMKSSKADAPSDYRAEQQDDRFGDYRNANDRYQPETIEPNFGDKDKPLNLPRKEGEVRYQENTPNTTQRNDRDFPSSNTPAKSGEKDISLGEYGSIKLPKKDGSSSAPTNTSSQRNTTSTRSQERMLVKLDPQTAIGDGTIDRANGRSLVVFENKSLQAKNSANLNIYIDTGGFTALTDCSNNQIYVKASGQLMMTGNGSNNTIYYEQGAGIRNGLASNADNNFIEVREIVFE